MASNGKFESIAVRSTVDGQRVEFYSDGAVTIGHPMSNKLVARNVPRWVSRVVADEICIVAASEVGLLIASGRRAHRSVINGAHRNFLTEETEVRRLTRAFFEIATAKAAA